MPKYEVTDTITYSRRFIVDAESKDDAISIVAAGNASPVAEDEIDNTPYEARRLKEDRNGDATTPGFFKSTVVSVALTCNCGAGGELGDHHKPDCPDHCPF